VSKIFFVQRKSKGEQRIRVNNLSIKKLSLKIKTHHMFYILFLALVISGIIIYLHYQHRIRKKQRLDIIRQEWGCSKTTGFAFERIEKYDLLTSDHSHSLSPQTLNDIDFQELFCFLDRTTSKTGQQYFYSKLKHPVTSIESLTRFNSLVHFFSAQQPVREAAQEELHHLSHRNAYFITSLLQDISLKKPEWLKYMVASPVLIAALLFASMYSPGLLILLILPAGLNMILHYWTKSESVHIIHSFPQLIRLIQITRKLSRIHPSLKDDTTEKSIEALKYFQSKSVLLQAGSDEGLRDELSNVFTYFIELIKAIFLIEVFVFYHLLREVETKKNSIRVLFDYIGNVDSAISVASLRAGASTCEPVLTHSPKTISTKNICHPLITNCVANDFHVRAKGILITGSNMSGKTTFLRTVIINSILAQTIFTCFADNFQSPVLKQFSSIRIDDSLMEAKSYYLEEVASIHYLIRETESPAHNLFVLDEVFKGTNTIERIAAAKAILSFLNRGNNIVIVSTHDIELAELLKSEFDLFHFSESIERNELLFDHKLKTGPLKTRNAIKILELYGFPEEIIREANSLSRSGTRNT
jgi:DNA mismatch repair ATPase MutS